MELSHISDLPESFFKDRQNIDILDQDSDHSVPSHLITYSKRSSISIVFFSKRSHSSLSGVEAENCLAHLAYSVREISKTPIATAGSSFHLIEFVRQRLCLFFEQKQNIATKESTEQKFPPPSRLWQGSLDKVFIQEIMNP